MKTLLKLPLAATLACALPVWACTPEEATAKREQLAQEVAKLTEQNPTKAKEINAELQKMDLGTTLIFFFRSTRQECLTSSMISSPFRPLGVRSGKL